MRIAKQPSPNNSDTPALELADIGVRFGGVAALESVSLSVDPGEVVSLIGPNGAGKTTLFNVIAGLQRPTTGTVRLHGEDLAALSPEARALRGIARTFQRMQLFEGLSVIENLVVARELADGSPFQRHRRSASSSGDLVDAEELLVVMGLKAVATRRVQDLSTGMRRRVELGRVLMTSATLVLLDEPTSGLDPSEREMMKGLIAEIATTGERRAVLLVEHDMAVALELAHRAYVLSSGQLVASGSPAEVRADPAVRSAYLGLTA